MKFGRVWILAVLGGSLFATGLLSAQQVGSKPKKIDYNRDIRPIITKCFTCHGPASGDGAAGLRLDELKRATTKLADGLYAIVPGKPDESELIKRINATDGSLMPPADTHKILSAEDKELMRSWILEGAEYKQHWAFVKPIRPAIPKVRNSKWVKTNIDAFVLSKLEENNLEPEPEASRETLIRRLSLDLTGLPATPEEVSAFAQDRSKDAYEKVVDRLLSSTRYGERMAMDWMDYARYADSNGYQADYERFQSRWRDWVIDAFNRNMPYDEFTVEQIAGDLLPNATTDQKLATAFNRNHRINTEGGVIPEEWRVETVVDRVETTSEVWLGLTSGCARCHNHKYDPISQKDFYRLFAYFNNVPESGTGEERPISHPPTMKAPTAAQAAQLSAMSLRLKGLDTTLSAALAKHRAKAATWQIEVSLPEVNPGIVYRSHFNDQTKSEGKVAFSAGRATGSVATSEAGFVDLGNIGDFERDHAFSFGGWLKPSMLSGTPFGRMDSNSAFRGWECSINDEKFQVHLINKWPENAIKVITKSKMPLGKWTHVLVTYDGTSKAAGLKVYLDGKLAETTVDQDRLTDTIRTGVSTKIGRRTNSEFYSGEVDDFVLFDRELQPAEAVLLASTHPALALLKIKTSARTAEQQNEISRLWSLEHDEAFRRQSEERLAVQNEKVKLESTIPEVMIMQEMDKPRDCYVLTRGQYDKHAEKVDAGLPDFLPKPPPGTPNNRLGLAKWIVSPDNPLTARVTVNRLWERFFGVGIVSTVEDFGTRAEFPVNPELLDYLAIEFIKQKWNLKGMIKEIVMSAAYRQSSQITSQKLAKDPENRLISRGPRFRLPGEVIRDQALFVSGLLVEKVGGPSVRPVQPEGIWDETNFYGNLRNYAPDLGPGLYRRSLYTIWKRTAAPPNMLLFDVPSRETCRVKRARTDTPLQALTLMNDETYLEAARVLAQRIIEKGGSTVEARITYGFQTVLGRSPKPEELALVCSTLQRRQRRYETDPAAAEKLINVGYAKVDASIKPAELAAYTLAASTLLNLDETITKE